jgi:hypothetical protein
MQRAALHGAVGRCTESLCVVAEHGDSVTKLAPKLHAYAALVLGMEPDEVSSILRLPSESQMRAYHQAYGAATQATTGASLASAKAIGISMDGSKIGGHNREVNLVTGELYCCCYRWLMALLVVLEC